MPTNSGIPAGADDTQVTVGPNFQLLPLNRAIVTPNGGAQAFLSDALLTLKAIMTAMYDGGIYHHSESRNPGVLDDAAHGYPTGEQWLNAETKSIFVSTTSGAGVAAWAFQEYAPQILPGDALAGLPIAVYGMRKLVEAYSGPCIKVNRGFDNFQFDVGFLPDGSLDVPTLSAFLVVADGTITPAQVTTWYDQTGNVRHATQATKANMPWIYRNSVNGNMTIAFDGQQSTVDKFFNLPAGVAVTQPALTMVAVARPTSSRALDGAIVEVGTAHTSSIQMVGNVLAGAAGTRMLTDATQSTLMTSEHEASVYIAISAAGANACTLWTNEVSGAAYTNSSSQAVTAGLIGDTNGASGKSFNGDMLSVILYNYGLSTVQRSNLADSIYRAFKLPPQRSGSNILFDGDSMSLGVNGLGWFGFSSIVPELMGFPAQAKNTGVNGQTMATLESNYPTTIAPLINTHTPNNILVVLAGTNDAVAGATAAATWTNLQSYITAATADGWKVIAVTMLPRGPAVESFRISYNNLMRAGAVTAGAVAVCDIASDPNIGQAGDNTNTTYYFGDQIHPNDLGHEIISAYMVATLNQVVT